MALTEDAKAELAAAIAIVREDRFEKFVRSHTVKPVEKPKDPVLDDDEKGPNPPPPKDDPETDPKNDPDKPKSKSAWWGELMEDDD